MAFFSPHKDGKLQLAGQCSTFTLHTRSFLSQVSLKILVSTFSSETESFRIREASMCFMWVRDVWQVVKHTEGSRVMLCTNLLWPSLLGCIHASWGHSNTPGDWVGVWPEINTGASQRIETNMFFCSCVVTLFIDLYYSFSSLRVVIPVKFGVFLISQMD